MKLQPLRVQAGWKITYNLFTEIDPTEENIDEFQGSSLLMIHHESANRLIDLSWRPERDINGRYILVVLNTLEVFNPKNNTLELDVDWNNPHLEFESKSRAVIVEKLEQLMIVMKPYEDRRILKNRGVLDQPSESFRVELENHGLNKEVAERIIAEGNKKIQDILLDHPEISKPILDSLADKGCTKGVKKKALQKLKSKKYRNLKN